MMSQTPKKKRTSTCRLGVEVMETRLMLSVSPTGPMEARDLTDVTIVPPPAVHGESRIDVLDFCDMASQFNDAHVLQKIDKVVGLPQLPDADEGALKLEDPSTFLRASGENAERHLSERLSDEYSTITLTASSQVAGSAGQATDSMEIVPVSMPSWSSVKIEESASPEGEPPASGQYKELFRETDRSGTDSTEKILENDFSRGDFLYEGGMVDFEGFFVSNHDSIGYTLCLSLDSLSGLDTQDRLTEDFAYDLGSSDHDFIKGIVAGDGASPWVITPMPDGLMGLINPGHPAGPLDLPAPPMPHSPGVREALLMTANMLSQDSSGENGANEDAASRLSPMSLYDEPQSMSHSLQNTNDEGGTYEENATLSELGSGDGTTSDAGSEELVSTEKQDVLESGNLEIEGIMNTSEDVLLVEGDATADQEGGMIDFTVAMNWSQKPVAATTEGIVEASVQQDGQFAMEGSYGRGQTFELATADEAENAPVENPTLEDASAALLESLNKMPLEDNVQENLDKTDLTPMAHEMALREMQQDLDYAAMLPSDALSWVTFALVGQGITRHPEDRKKKNEK